MRVTPASVWADLSEPWQVCIDEAWRSWSAGSAGVGCVVTDPRGAIVAERGGSAVEAMARCGTT